MATEKHFTQILIKANGQPLPEPLMDALGEVVVDSSLYQPNMFSIVVRDPKIKWVDDQDYLAPGKEIEIKVQTGAEQGNLKGLLMCGEITSLEPSFSAQGRTTLLVRGYDKSHRLHRGKQTRTFANLSIAQIIKTIAEEADLIPELDATTVRYDYLLQNNQTNMEFLLALAERVGFQVYAAEGTLFFKKSTWSQGNGPEFELGETLSGFQPRLSTIRQTDRVTVKGWDAKSKNRIMGQASPNSDLNQGGLEETGGATAKKIFRSTAESVLVNQPVFSAAEAEALAARLSDDLSREFIQAEGICRGDPRVKAGWFITLKGLGQRFSGHYFVTSATHTYSAAGYETRFTITGRHPQTLRYLLRARDDRLSAQPRLHGVVTGLVTNLNDKFDLGRVKVKYNWLGDIESDWVRIASPMAGPDRGFFYLPEINDEVLVAFEHGDMHRPYIIGVLWNSQDKPPKSNTDVVGGGKVNQRLVKSRSGHQILLDDSSGGEKIEIIDRSGQKVVIDSQAQSIELSGGGRKVTMRNGQVHIT
ncbi:MAG: VgrG-related protein [Anaerolineales bacterium]|nr:VgrG-related protein [Anaerolineales bacterium]